MDVIAELIAALQKYFNLMYDSDIENFDEVFSPTARLHGYRDGEMVRWSAGEYKEVLRSRRSPLAAGSPRQSSVLLLDVASTAQAFAKGLVITTRRATWQSL